MILYCNCAHKDVVPASTKGDVLSGLSAADVDLVAVPDLCELAANRDPMLENLVSQDQVKIVACYPRAVKWLLQWAGVQLDMERVELFNMRDMSAEDILAGCVGETVSAVDGVGRTAVDGCDDCGEWVPWFPVIDYDRCTNCKQCISFCPFGVYSLSADRTVVVENPRQCKDNCPACARMCPSVAIVFPKVPDSPINGAVVQDEDSARRQATEVSKQIKESGDIHSLLAQRRKKAKRKFIRREVTAPEVSGHDEVDGNMGGGES